jgi:hypothetical protein
MRNCEGCVHQRFGGGMPDACRSCRRTNWESKPMFGSSCLGCVHYFANLESEPCASCDLTNYKTPVEGA